MTPLRYNRVRRSRRTRLYQVCITDGAIYAKVFEARSPRHAFVQASVDTEQNRDWRNDWEIIDGVVTIDPHPTLVVSDEEVQP